MAESCYLQSHKCGFSDNSQIALLKWIGLEVKRSREVKIGFDDNQKSFFIDGATRIARTGSRWGDIIIFNSLVLYKKTGNGYRPLDLFEIAAIYIHELGHHQKDLYLKTGLKEPEHDELDIIAGKTINYLMKRSRISNLSLSNEGLLEARVININFEMFNGIRNRWSRYYFDNGQSITELGSFWRNDFKCPVRYREGRVVFDGRPLSVSLRQLSAPKIEIREDGLSYTQKIGKATASCVDDYSNEYEFFDGYKNGILSLYFFLSQGVLEFDKEKSFFTATMPERYGRL